MLPKISVEFLKSIDACKFGIQAYIECGKPANLFDVLDVCKTNKNVSYGAWLITKLLNKQNNVKFAIYCAELVLPLFEGQYPEDKRPREAIESAKNWLSNQDSGNVVAAYDDARSARNSAYVVIYATRAAACVAYAAEAAAANAAAAAAADAADAAANAAYAAAAAYDAAAADDAVRAAAAAADAENAAVYAAAEAYDAAADTTNAAAYAAAAADAASDYLTHINQTIDYAKTLLKEQYENV